MLSEMSRVSSARAAEIVGVGYEGFRSYLKRGLLGRVGMLPGFHRAASNTYDDPRPRNKWTMFGFADLSLMRIAKVLMDAGFTFVSANAVVSQHEIWSHLAHDDEPTERYLLIWPPYGDYIIFEVDELHRLPESVREVKAKGAFTLLNLGEVQSYVAEKLSIEAAA
jgi:hypothetical protein